MKKILVLEDDPVLGQNLKLALKLEGYDADVRQSLKAAREALEEVEFRLALLDVNLPDGNGIELCKEIRELYPALPILMLTARQEEETAVQSFSKGADDYIRKPFGTKELLIRIQKHLGPQKELQFEGLVVNRSQRQVLAGKNKLNLTPREFDILVALIEQPENVITREQMMRLIDPEGTMLDRTLDSHLSRLRGKLKDADCKLQISMVYGVGYRLEKR